MKKVLFIIVFLTGSCYAQISDSIKSVVIADTLTHQDRSNIYEAGWALKQYNTWSYVGAAAFITGGVVTGIGATLNTSQGAQTGVIISGAIISGIGAIIQFIICPGFVGKAGNFLIKLGN